MSKRRVVPERTGPAPDPLTQGERQTWAAYLAKALVERVKRDATEDGYKSASAYVEDLLVFAVRTREAERVEDRLKK